MSTYLVLILALSYFLMSLYQNKNETIMKIKKTIDYGLNAIDVFLLLFNGVSLDRSSLDGLLSKGTIDHNTDASQSVNQGVSQEYAKVVITEQGKYNILYCN